MMDARAGGKYQITIVSPDGQSVSHHGEYVLFTPYTDLVFTWVLDGQECAGSEGQSADTLVSLTFVEQDGKTELHLVHERLPDQDAKDGHMFGWTSCLDSLSEMINKTQ